MPESNEEPTTMIDTSAPAVERERTITLKVGQERTAASTGPAAATSDAPP